MFFTGYNADPNEISSASAVVFEDASLTKQSFKDECDINTIVRNFGLTGQLPVSNNVAPQYGDFTDVVDYRTALDAVIQANDSFMSLPAEVRKRFGNDPADFVDFCSDPNNRDELIKLGLVVPTASPPSGDASSTPST